MVYFLRKRRVEEYLEIIYELTCRGERVGVRKLAQVLGIKPSSVVEYLRKLCSEGYVVYEKGGYISLTEKGLELANEVKVRHNVIKEFLVLIGVPEDVAEIDACYIEHGVHKETIDKISELTIKLKTQHYE